MAGAPGKRKRKRGGRAKASRSGNAINVAQKAGKRTTTSVSSDEVVPVARPVRERKAVDWFLPGPQPNEKVRQPEVFSIEQGPGTKLRDIPNVAFKLSKRKADKNLQVLHTILYGRKSNVYPQKNILQFSGFIWAENEEKERTKVKKRIDKCKKERLLLLCELLDIPGMKATTNKEEVSTKLLEFLESPHVTRSVAENVERSRKRKRIKESSNKKAYGEGEDAEEGGGEEEDAEGLSKDAGEAEDTEDAGEEGDAEGSDEDTGGEEGDAEGSDEDTGGGEGDAEGSDDEDTGGGGEGDAEGSDDEDTGEEEEEEGNAKRLGEDAGEDPESGEDAGISYRGRFRRRW